MTQHNHAGTPEEKQAAVAKADAVLQQLMTSTPDQIEQWIDNNVTNFAEIKVMFKRVILLILASMRT